MVWRKAVDPARVKEAFEQVPRDCPIVDGVLLDNVPVPITGWNQIEHGLGRVPKGAILLFTNYSVSTELDYCLFKSFGRTGLAAYEPTEKYIYFYHSVAQPLAAISLWVF